MTIAERVLEIGIGTGGKHIIRDSVGTLRIGADINRKSLIECRNEYGVPSVVFDAFNYESLPFTESIFDQVEITCPHDELLYALSDIDDHSFWSELRRVLVPEGCVKVVFDVPPDNSRLIKVKGRSMRIYEPERRIWQSAADADFKVSLQKVSDSYLRSLNTPFSMKMADKVKKNPGYSAYQLIASKSEEL